MTSPKLRVRASGLGGSGYSVPTRKLESGKNLVVPGVTTVLGVLDKPGVLFWSIQQTAAYAVAIAPQLAERDSDWGFRQLQFYHNRKPDWDDPLTNLQDYHRGVLNDLAETGTNIHELIDAYAQDDLFGPEPSRPENEEAFGVFLEWVEANDVKFLETEQTVFNPDEGFAGTFDGIISYRGRKLLVDWKTSRKIHDSHISQAAALANAPVLMREVQEGLGDVYDTKASGPTYWVEEPMPAFDGVAVVQVRPRSIDEYGNDILPFVELHEVKPGELDPSYEAFLGALQVRKAQAKLRDARNAAKREKENDVDYF